MRPRVIGCRTRAAGDASQRPIGLRDAVPRPLATGRRLLLSRSIRVARSISALFFTQRGSHRKINGHFGLRVSVREGSPDPGAARLTHTVLFILSVLL